MPSFSDTPRRISRAMALLTCAALVAPLVAGCSDSGSDTDAPDRGVGSGPLTTTLHGGGNSVYPPDGVAAGDSWSATFGSLLICSPEQVTITDIVPRYQVGVSVKEHFLVRTVPTGEKRAGRPIHWSPVGTSTKAPADMVTSGDLRYTTLTGASGATVDQPCSDDPDAPFTEILTSIAADTGGVWIDGLDVQYKAGGKAFSLPVDWSYVACGDLIKDPDIC